MVGAIFLASSYTSASRSEIIIRSGSISLMTSKSGSREAPVFMYSDP